MEFNKTKFSEYLIYKIILFYMIYLFDIHYLNNFSREL